MKDYHALTTVKRISEKTSENETKLVDYMRVWSLSCFPMRSPTCRLTLVATFTLQALEYGKLGWKKNLKDLNKVGTKILMFNPMSVENTLRNLSENPRLIEFR